MCGICGFFGSPSLGSSELERMTVALRHRGPDDQGLQLFAGSGAGLGHRRLAILDLSPRGRQPMTLAGSGLWIVFNGEVFNFLELRRELESLGHSFASESDTEVVLAGYREWGEAAFARFNGMWALAIYDERQDVLLLCRDRYGIKPLYYVWDGRQLVFASEVKALRAVGGQLPLSWDPTGLATALDSSFNLEASGHTLLRGVANLLPGHLAVATAGGLNVRRWWSTLDHLEPPPATVGEQVERFRELFTDACRLRMRSDVPIGTALSGGVDSSSVVATIAAVVRAGAGGARTAADWQRAFVHTFEGTPLDETSYAVAAAGAAGCSLTRVAATDAEVAATLDTIVAHLEAVYPGMPDSLWRLYRGQRAGGVVVSLDGHGADEMLAGYDWHLAAAMADASVLSRRYWALLRTRKGIYGYGLPSHFVLRSLLQASGSLALVAKAARQRVKGRFLSAAGRRAMQYSPVTERLPREWDPLQRMLYRDFHQSVLPRILKNFDLMSMAHGVEVRMPFMDYRLVDFAFSLPSSVKIADSYTKWILREAMKGTLPESIRLRKMKIGFNSPILEWLRSILRDWVEATLGTPSAASDLVDVAGMRRFYRERLVPGRAKFDEALVFWSYLTALRVTAS